MMTDVNPQLLSDIKTQVARALAEDIGPGDLTASLIDGGRTAGATVLAREPAVLCGGPWFEETFRQIDARVAWHWSVAEGDAIAAGQVVCRLEGPAPALLSGERCALNFLQTLSGTATATRRFVDAIRGTKAVIVDTRKTLPGLRTAQKYAVRCGGGTNHRIGLFDAVLVKENHIAAAGGITAVMRRVAERIPAGTPVQVEVESLAQLQEALACGVRMILLDNFSIEAMREAVALTAGRAALEASGGVRLEAVRAIAETGVDRISIGALTKDVHALDLSMRFHL
jgi:nicotinate-nucleotide pyrophosphorylase (carboxylating)